MLPDLLANFGVTSLLDAACGDFQWMKSVDIKGVRYYGIDIVPAVVANNNRVYGSETRSFFRADITRDSLPQADLILCRDALVHLTLEDALAALHNFVRSNSRYLLATTYLDCDGNIETITGDWRLLNLRFWPFNLPAPIAVLSEGFEDQEGRYDKCLGLWPLAEVAAALRSTADQVLATRLAKR